MNKLILPLLILILFNEVSYSQKNNNLFYGIWKFQPEKKSNDITFISFIIFQKNKQLGITFWNNSKKSNTYGNPFTYYGFWDNSCYLEKNECPKELKDLKSNGKYIFFYDNLITPKKNQINIGYDRLGNLYEPTRRCQWSINEDLPEGLPPTTLSLYFNMNPDVYKKVDTIPYFVLNSLKNNIEDWKKYLDFIGHQEKHIKSEKSTIYTSPNIPTKMYLVKSNEVEIIEEKDKWLKIRYYSKKSIEGWVKKEDVE